MKVPPAEVPRKFGGFWTNFTAFSLVVMLRNTWFDSGYIFFVSLWMALQEFQIFLRDWVDSRS